MSRSLIATTKFIHFIYMVVYIIQVLLTSVYMSEEIKLQEAKRMCGLDKSLDPVVYEGVAKIESFPWLGVLHYTRRQKLITTNVVLVAKQLVIGSAPDISRIPKEVFRQRAKVFLGQNCSSDPGIGLLDYNYHPEYPGGDQSGLVIIQLDLTDVNQDCTSSDLNIYEMKYVAPDECKHFYRRNGLYIENVWPPHTACGQAESEAECVWRNGNALVVKQDHRWHLLGFGVAGPGCGAPSLFLDYGQYQNWVLSSVTRIGRPAVTRLGPNYLIMRRTASHIQRFGPCDPAEVEIELFTDRTQVEPRKNNLLAGKAKYNVTILANVDYSCISFRAWYDKRIAKTYKPKITLKRYCTTPIPICYDAGILEINFYVEIIFFYTIVYKVSAYGQELKIVDSKALTKYTNEKHDFPSDPPKG